MIFVYCGIFAQSKNGKFTTAGRYYGAARKQQRMMFSAQSVSIAAHATMEYSMPSLSNSCTATEERCFLCGPCRSYIMSWALKSSPRVEAGPNTSTIALRVVGGDEKGTQCLGV
jgi:hypothetical protein